MLYKVLTRLIEKGETEGLAEKIDVLYASGRLTKEEYEELVKLLNKGA